MAERPYLTSAEAATYCGFKTIGGIQQAVRRGKLKPAGRRGGTGTYVFAREDLDAFLTGGLQPHERLFVALDSPAAPGAEPLHSPPSPPSVAALAPGRSPKLPEKGPRAKNPLPEPAPQRDSQPTEKFPKSAKLEKPQKPQKSRQPANDDPVARIIRALAFAPAKPEKAGKRPAAR